MNISKIKEEFEVLPTIPPTEETLSFIDKILDDPEISKKDRYEFADIFFDLISRLTANYAHLQPSQVKKIISWIEENWDEKNIEYTDLLVSIVINADDSVAKDFLKVKINLSRNPLVKKILREALEEISA